MKKSDELFLKLFKNINIEIGDDSVQVYDENRNQVKHSDVVRLVKEYQEAIISSLMEVK